MLANIKGLAQGVAQRFLYKNAAGRFYFFGIFPYDGDADGGDAGVFNRSLDQSDGLVADGSARSQKGNIRSI